MASIHCNANFSEIRSVVDFVLRELGNGGGISCYPMTGRFFPAGGDLIAEGRRIGRFGVLRPLVLKSFGLEKSMVAMELQWGDF